MKRWTARLLALAAIALIALAAPTLVAADNVTLSVWLGPNNTDAIKQIFDDYTKATGIQFDQTVFPVPFEQNLLAKWATGERPDILQFHAIGNWLVQLNPEQNLIDQSDMPFVKNTVAGLLVRHHQAEGTERGPHLFRRRRPVAAPGPGLHHVERRHQGGRPHDR